MHSQKALQNLLDCLKKHQKQVREFYKWKNAYGNIFQVVNKLDDELGDTPQVKKLVEEMQEILDPDQSHSEK